MAEWLDTANELFAGVEIETTKVANNSFKTELNKQGVFNALQNPETYATVLLAICLINYGNETFQVEPLVLFQWLKEDFGTELHEDNENKLQAILIALTTDYFFTDLSVFQNICKTLESGDPDLAAENPLTDPATIPEIMWGVYEVALNSEDQIIDNLPFSPQVDNFITKVLDTDVDDFDDTDIVLQQADVVKNNVAEMKEQFHSIGILEIPKFPSLEI